VLKSIVIVSLLRLEFSTKNEAFFRMKTFLKKRLHFWRKVVLRWDCGFNLSQLVIVMRLP